MKCQILFSGQNKKNVSKCDLLRFLPTMLNVKRRYEMPNTCLVLVIMTDNHSNHG